MAADATRAAVGSSYIQHVRAWSARSVNAICTDSLKRICIIPTRKGVLDPHAAISRGYAVTVCTRVAKVGAAGTRGVPEYAA